MFTQPPQIPRSPFASTLTVVFHVCLGLIVIAVSAVPNVPEIIDQKPLTYVMAAPVPDLRFEIPPPPPPAPPPLKPVPRVEIPTPEAPKAIERPVIAKPPPAPEPEPERRRAPPPEIPAPVPTPRPVVVGAFSDAAAARTTERRIAVVDPGFASTSTEAARARREVAEVEGFDASVPSTSRRDRPELVANAGFGTAAPDGQVRRATQTVAAAGFGNADASPRPAQGPRGVSASGFGDTPAASATRAAPPRAATAGGFEQAPAPKPAAPPPPRPPQADKPVEVLYKPTPAYTDAAREARVEGEVALEVEFTAAGQVRVLRVVRGLGFGLDEMARQAAERIRFRPATSRGTPVDFRATLTIVFRLT